MASWLTLVYGVMDNNSTLHFAKLTAPALRLHAFHLIPQHGRLAQRLGPSPTAIMVNLLEHYRRNASSTRAASASRGPSARPTKRVSRRANQRSLRTCTMA